MNPIAEELRAIYEESEELAHIGVKRRSGRYPWGSGEDPYQRTGDFLGRIEQLKKQGWKETPENIKKEFGVTTSQYRLEKACCLDERKLLQIARAKSLKEDGLNTSEIGREMGVNESTVRGWFDKDYQARAELAKNTADYIRDQIEKKGMIDVGKGTDRELNISREKLEQALYMLESEGYPIHGGRFEQPTNPGQWTTQRVICPKGTPHSDIFDKLDQIHPLNEDNYISRDDGKTFEKKFHYPESMDSKRMMIRYKEEGGIDRDGLVELRRGVEDLSLGESRYSQVRILVDGTHYIKGMAAYSDDKNFPPGVDVIFNTNKPKGTPMTKVLKEIKDNPDNPFGSAIKDVELGGQYWYTDKSGKRKLGLINKRADEGDWEDWKDTLPSQFLAKQSKFMAKKQLDLARADKQMEFDEICSLTNPTIKKHLLQKFSDSCDAAAVDLKAAALPGQKYHVMIPINTLKDNEVYAPNYADGTKLALIRYPHGGTFEIPVLTVNNKNKLANEVITKNSIDAIGVNSKNAEQLSGADFDGDTVMCIPTHDAGGKVKIAHREPLRDLEGFDPKMEYPERKGMKYMKDPVTKTDNTQKEMGVISNLITDMTLAGAKDDELARAVRHSMVVIDAGKHKLDYKRSEMDNGIKELKQKYQPKYDADGNLIGYGGASTLISRSKGEKTIDKRQGSPKINIKGTDHYDPSKPEGSLIWKTADDVEYQVTKVNKRTGEITTTTKRKHNRPPSTQMAETDDAYALVSKARHPMEIIYADHANAMKAMANKARIEMVNTGKIQYDANAKKTYQAEYDSLMSKLNNAELNTARERAANRQARAEVNAKLASGQIEKKDLTKEGAQALTRNRLSVGSISRKDRSIKITDREWEAIQAGAISETKLKRILNNTDIDVLRERATPRKSNAKLSTAQVNMLKNMSNSNYTLEQMAKKFGVSTSTISGYLKSKGD